MAWYDVDVDFEMALRRQYTARMGEEPTTCQVCSWSGCCCQLVAVSDHEAAAIIAQYGAALPWPRIEARVATEAQYMTDAKGYFALGLPCMFAYDDDVSGKQRCRVYDVRPWNCARTYMRACTPRRCLPGTDEGGGELLVTVNALQVPHLFSRPEWIYAGLCRALVKTRDRLAEVRP